MRTLVIIGGYAPDSFDYGFAYDRIIAADSGYDTARKLGIEPDLVVGDFDSTSYIDEILKKSFKRMPKDKDETDAELALMEVEGEYDLLGGGEGRLDHTLAILMLFGKYGYPRYWFTREDTLIAISEEMDFYLPKDIELSLFALSSSVVSTKGLFWDMESRVLDSTFLSLSNRMREDRARVTATSPVFLRLAPKDFMHFVVVKQ